MVQVYNGRLFTPLPGLRRVREEKGFSQRGLARASGMSYVNISKIESGQQRATMSSFEKLAIALDVDCLEELLLDEEGIKCLAERKGDLVAT